MSIIIDMVSNIIELLVNKQYSEIERITSGTRLPAKEIEAAIRDYGHLLIIPPLSEYNNLDIIAIKSTTPSWSVRMNLWTQDEGKSDLTIELTIKEKGSTFSVELDDIHVL
jgi:hypothetical protein